MVKLDNVTEGVLDVINDNKFSQTEMCIRDSSTAVRKKDNLTIFI